MKLIEAMKLIKELQRKADDLRQKVAAHSAILSFETPVYQDQAEQVRQWIQSHTDIMREILRLRVAVQRTNLSTSVEIELGGTRVSKTIAEWIHRRRDLAQSDMAMWKGLTDRGLKEQIVQRSATDPKTEIKIVRFYDPLKRDEMVSLYDSEPGIIDRKLEVINAITDLIE